VNRFWSILFFLVPLLAIGSFVMANLNVWPLEGLQSPNNVNRAGKAIDHLFRLVPLLAAAILLSTGSILAWTLWRFDHRRNRISSYFSSNIRLEFVWSVVPGLILIALAAYQWKAWSENKINRPMISMNGERVPKPPHALIRAKQFGWEIYYPGLDGHLETQDDIYVENLLVVPADEDITLQFDSRDVIHSFSVAALRLKQDIVPGMTQFVWFHATAVGQFEIACTELCGWGHYKMKGLMRIVPRREFEDWMLQQTELMKPSSIEQ
jgi:cytochrome c oxidase subunit 2